MNRRMFFVMVLVCTAALLGRISIAAAQQKQSRPNIVWIFVEDQNGWYGCYGDNTVPTPHLDALAKRHLRRWKAVAVLNRRAK